jgi:NADH-quinone oxidoreductase subunit L
VSALIHAATMVTAGVYMVARCSLLFALAPVTMEIVAIVGLATAVIAATMGLVQKDIKKVLAYSTVSQLGYMFLGLGMGAFTAGIFHVMTHAFFKALLFLGAGAVIHALHDEQDITKMGGLRSHMPRTYALFFVAALAIAGIPPLSGFFSKDEILWKAFANGSIWFWVFGWLTAGLTAFYMFRLVSLTFEGAPRWTGAKHPHEPPATMLVPLAVLGLLSVVGGFAGIPHSLGGTNALEQWLEPVFARAALRLPVGHLGGVSLEYLFMGLSVAIAALGIVAARRLYLDKPATVTRLAERFSGPYRLFARLYYVDDVYDAAVVRPIVKGSERLLWRGFDVGVIDRLVNGTARMFNALAELLRKVQGGVVQGYALAFVIGIVVILGILIWR